MLDESNAKRDEKDQIIANLNAQLDLQNPKQEIETKQVMDAFKKSGKSMHELMVFLEG